MSATNVVVPHAHALQERPDVRSSGRDRASTAILPAGPATLVRDVILGGQDGLVNVLGLVLGMAAATADAHVVITAGLAALLAESISMAGVAFTSTNAERQLIARARAGSEAQRAALQRDNVERRHHLLRDLTMPGLDRVRLEAAVNAEAAAWERQIDRELTAVQPIREERPARAAILVGLSTALGSSVPLIPFLLAPIAMAAPAALVLAAVVLAAAGFERADLTGGARRRAVLEMVAIGLVSALAGYLIGQALRSPAG
jgi:vacuolar iron transporter family protein